MNLHPPPDWTPLTVRQAIGHLPMQESNGRRRQELIDAWHKCPPGKSLRKAVPNISSVESVKLHADRPGTTQTANHFNWHFASPRYLTIGEMALIGGLPPDFKFPARQGRCKNQIGDFVPPLFMRAISRHVREKILALISKEEITA